MALTLIAALAISAIAFFLHRLYRRLNLWWRFRKAREGERRAAALLKQSGYRIIASQVEHPSVIRVDGRPYTCTIRADYLVSKAGKSYVAEVKTGLMAPDPTNSATRRQLLEYALAFPTDGVLLVDAEQSSIHAVEFDGLTSRFENRYRRWSLVSVGILLTVSILLVSIVLTLFKVIP